MSVPRALTEAARSGCARHWPAHGRQGCSTWDGTGSLSVRRERREGAGGKEAEGDGVGRRPLLTWVFWAEESKRIPTPSPEARPPRTELTSPLPWVYHTACGTSATQLLCRTLQPGLTGRLPAAPPLPGLGRGHSPGPGLPGAPDRSPSSASPPPSQRRGQGPGSTQRRFGSAWMGPTALPPGPGWRLWTRQLRACAPPSPLPH